MIERVGEAQEGGQVRSSRAGEVRGRETGEEAGTWKTVET